MAAPNNRRPSYSRKAQFGNFFGYLAAIGGLALGVLFLFATTDKSGAFSVVRSGASDIGSSAGSVVADTRAASQRLWATIEGYFTSGARVARLKQEVDEARVKLAEQAALREENNRLKSMLGLSQSSEKPVAIAHMIGSTSASTRRYATISVGSNRGVRPGMAVRTPLGLVGRVVETGRYSARVLLITDTDSSIPVRRASDGLQAYAHGRGDGTVQIRLSTMGFNPLHKGDAIVTSGSGGIFRPNMAVAVVVGLTVDGAIARPLSDPALTEYVAVEPLFEEKAADSELADPEK